MIGVLVAFVGGVSCSSESDGTQADACALLQSLDVGIELVNLSAFVDGPNVVGCRAFASSSNGEVRLRVHRRGSEAEAQEFGESYLSDPPSDATGPGSKFAKAQSGRYVLVLESTVDVDLLAALADVVVTDESLEFGAQAGSDTSASAITTQLSDRVVSPLTLVIESQTEGEVCYRIDSGEATEAFSSCFGFGGQLFRQGGPPAMFMHQDAADERVVRLYAIEDGFEVVDVLIEPQDVEWGTAPSGWLLVTTASDAPIQLVMRSSDGTIVCSPKFSRTSCETFP